MVSKSILSVVIITLNEEENLPRCLSSLPQGCDVVIIDSGSQDATVDIAKKFGCRVFHRNFDDYAQQKNFAISKSKFPWVLSLDADEELGPKMGCRILDILRSNPDCDAFTLRRQLVFMGRFMKYGRTVDYPIRLFKKDQAFFHKQIHECLKVQGVVRPLRGVTLFHHSYKDLSDYFQRFNKYTTLIAKDKFARQVVPPPLFFVVLRVWLEFFKRYFLRLGFLDGYAGYTYALVSSFYAHVKYAKLLEKFYLQSGEE